MDERISIQQLVDRIAERSGVSRTEAEAFVSAFFDVIEAGLAADRYVKVRGLGTFKLIDVESRESINVRTGERFQIEGHSKVTFVPDAALKELVNKPFSHFETIVIDDDTPATEEPIDIEEAKPEEPVDVPTEPALTPTEPLIDPIEPASEDEIAPAEPVAVDEQPIDEPEPAIEPIEKVEEGPISPGENVVETPVEGPGPAMEHIEKTEEEPIAPIENIQETPVEEPSKPSIEEPTEESIADTPTEKRGPSTRTITIIAIVVIALCACAVAYLYWPDLQFAFRERTQPVAPTEQPAPAEPEPTPEVPTDTVPATPVAPRPTPTPSSASTPVRPDSTSRVIVGTLTEHTVQAGETLTRIALRYYGTKDLWPYIVKHNADRIANPNDVAVGTTLRIPELQAQ